MLDAGERGGARRDHHVAAEQKVGAAGGDANRVQIVRPRREAHVAHHCAVLLRQPGEIQHRAALALEMRRHAEQRADRDHARAADAGHENAVGADQRPSPRYRQLRERVLGAGDHGPAQLAQRPAVHRDEARAEPFEAGEILVAVGLVDGALAPELGLDRLDGDAIGFFRAIAAALAHRFVDEDALLRVRVKAALAAPPLLGRAGLIVDEHREARRLAQLALDGVELVAMADLNAPREAGIGRIFLGLVGDHDDAFGALGFDLPGDLRNVELAFHRLAAGHGDGVIVENLVGDVDARGGGGADRQ